MSLFYYEFWSICSIIRGMKLYKKLNLMWIITLTLVLVFGALIFALSIKNVNAEDGEAEEDFTVEMIREGAKYVTIFDDGEKLTVKSGAKTVGEVLEKVEIILNEGDIVEPGLETEIDMDNYYINIYRARPVLLRDGKMTKYVMAAGYDARTFIKQAGLTLYDGDEVKMVPNASFLETGVAEVYEITRNGGRTITEEVEIPFGETTIKDYNLAPGTTEVRQLGEVGMKEVLYNVLYVDGVEVSREYISEGVKREPVSRIVAVGASKIEQRPLTPSMGRNRYTVTLADGRVVERQETYYDLPMSGVMGFCGGGSYSVRADGAKIDQDGYVLVAANLSRYPRCSVVETSLGLGKVYDTGAFAVTNPEQFDLATDWTNRNGR